MSEKKVFDERIEAALQKAASKREISFTRNLKIGKKPGGLNLIANWHLTDSFNRDRSALLLTRFQDKSGSTEEKITSLLIRLKVAADQDKSITKIWLVLGGHGWTDTHIQFLKRELSGLVPDLFKRIRLIDNTEDLDAYDFADF